MALRLGLLRFILGGQSKFHVYNVAPDRFATGGPTLTTFFCLVYEGREDPIGHHRHASETRADDGPTFNSGLVALGFLRGSGPVLLGNRFFFIFQGGSGPPVAPPLDAPMHLIISTVVCNYVNRWSAHPHIK